MKLYSSEYSSFCPQPCFTTRGSFFLQNNTIPRKKKIQVYPSVLLENFEYLWISLIVQTLLLTEVRSRRSGGSQLGLFPSGAEQQ